MVARTAGAIDRPTGTRRVEILLVNRDNRLLPGMFANVTLQMQAEEPRKKGIGEKPPPAPKNAEALQALLKTRLDAAQKTCDVWMDGLGEAKRPVGSGLNIRLLPNPEEVHTWSVRLLNAQRDMSDQKEKQVAALEEHFKRMQTLQKKLAPLAPGLLPQGETLAAAWYVAEAEVWLAREKAK